MCTLAHTRAHSHTHTTRSQEVGAAKRPKKTAKEMKEHAKALKASSDFRPKEKKPPAKKSEKKKSEKKDKKRKSDSGVCVCMCLFVCL